MHVYTYYLICISAVSNKSLLFTFFNNNIIDTYYCCKCLDDNRFTYYYLNILIVCVGT